MKGYEKTRKNEKNSVKDTGKPYYAALLFCLTLFLFVPINILYNNVNEFSARFIEMWIIIIIITITSIILSFILINKFRIFNNERVISILFTLAFLLWFQGNILLWNYGIFDGTEIDWNSKSYYGVIDGAIWIILLTFSAIKPRLINKISKKASILLIIIQIISLIILFTQPLGESRFKQYHIDNSNKYSFSNDTNVVILVLDTFQSNIFQEIITESPEYAEYFDGFTYFRNALGGYPTTYASIPLILTGQYYNNTIPIQEFIKQAYSGESLPKLLKSEGYYVTLPLENTIYADESISSNYQKRKLFDNAINIRKQTAYLYDITLFRILPHSAKKQIFDNNKWLLSKVFSKSVIINQNRNRYDSCDPDKINDLIFNEGIINLVKVNSENKTFKFFHTLTPHPPFNINETLECESMEWDRESSERQAKGALFIAKNLIDILKQNQVFDNSLIIIMGDHGNGNTNLFRLTEKDYINADYTSNSLGEHGMKNSALPLVLIKRINSSGKLHISDSPVTSQDIAKTIFSELDIHNNLSGQDVYGSIKKDRQREFYYYSWSDYNWKTAYLPTMKKYIVSGISWLDESWEDTYLLYGPGGVKRVEYKFGAVINFSRGGNYNEYYTKGLSGPEKEFTWIEGNTFKISLPINLSKKDLHLKIKLLPFIVDKKVNSQKVYVKLNDRLIDEKTFYEQKIQEYIVNIPPETNSDRLDIELELPNAISPKEIGFNRDERKISIALYYLIIESN